MLKKTLLAAAVLGFAVNAQAFDLYEADGYVFGNIGYAKTKKPGVVKDEASWIKGVGGSAKYDGDNTAFKLGAGINLNEYLALELQYTNFGKRDAKNRLPQYDYVGKGTLDTWGLGLNVVAGTHIDALEQFRVYGKLGLHHMTTEATLKESALGGAIYDKDKSKKRSVTPVVGLGVSYALTEELALTAEYDYFNKGAQFRYYNDDDRKKTSKNDIHMGSVGLRYSF